MYYHNAYTHQVDWEPEYEQHAVTAMQEVVIDSFDPDNGPIEVEQETAQQINARYRELLTNDPEIEYPPNRDTNEETQ